MDISGIRSIVKILSKNAEMRLPQKTLYKVLAFIAVFAIMIPCVVIVGFISFVMTEALIEVNNPGNGMLFEMQILSAFSMIFGILVIFSVLFFSSDREHFVTLPIPAHHLMMARFIYSYMAESIMEFLVLGAVYVGYFIAASMELGVLKALNPISVIAALLGTFAIPLVPMIYCALFAIALMVLLKGVKNVNVFYKMSSVFLLIFTLIFVYSLRGLGDINIENYVESLGNGDNSFLKTLNIIFFPVVWLSEAVSRGNVLYLLLYIVSNIALLAILYFVGKALYQEGLYTAASLGSDKKEGLKKKDIVVESQFMASLKKELRVILRTRAFANNTAYINLLWPVGTFCLFHFAGDKGAIAMFVEMYSSGKERADMILIMLMVSVAFVASALNSLAATSFTREGQHLELIKFIPVPFKTQMYAKAMVSFIFTYPALLVTDIIVCAYIDAGIVRCLVIAVFMLLAHVIALVAGMILDSSSPYVEWSDEYSALRGNLNAFFNMAVMMFVSLLVIALGLLLYEVLKLPVKTYYIVMFLTLLVAAIRFVMVGPKVIIKNMSKLF
ncbi:MAG: hypothetical protein K6G76_02805 [Lachnospiraceae bacterium]|nr:hypothetical protein [Lachnospiraceae bacterium]